MPEDKHEYIIIFIIVLTMIILFSINAKDSQYQEEKSIYATATFDE